MILRALQTHWPEYLMEAGELGAFMLSASLFAVTLEHPISPVREALGNPRLRRVLMGIAMGATAAAIIYSPWGRRSGAHFNPAVTLAFYRLGRIARADATFYVLAQFAGAVAGLLVAAAVLGPLLAAPGVDYVATRPGTAGITVAFVAEIGISFLMMLVILAISNTTTLARFTGLAAAILVAVYISVEAPLSGMSMNPARSFAPATLSQVWTAAWVYLIAPPMGMLLATTVYVRAKGARAVRCAKLAHDRHYRCIFHCGYAEKQPPVVPVPSPAAML